MSEEKKRIRPIWILIPAVLLLVLVGKKMTESSGDANTVIPSPETVLDTTREVTNSQTPESNMTPQNEGKTEKQTKPEQTLTPSSDKVELKGEGQKVQSIDSQSGIPNQAHVTQTASDSLTMLTSDLSDKNSIYADIEKLEKALVEARAEGQTDRVADLARTRDSLMHLVGIQKVHLDTQAALPATRMIEALRQGKSLKEVLRNTK